MTNYDRYVNVFVNTFDIDSSSLDTLEYQGIENWDSVGHMGLIAAIEDEFGIELSDDVIEDLSTVGDLAKYVAAHKK